MQRNQLFLFFFHRLRYTVQDDCFFLYELLFIPRLGFFLLLSMLILGYGVHVWYRVVC